MVNDRWYQAPDQPCQRLRIIPAADAHPVNASQVDLDVVPGGRCRRSRPRLRDNLYGQKARLLRPGQSQARVRRITGIAQPLEDQIGIHQRSAAPPVPPKHPAQPSGNRSTASPRRSKAASSDAPRHHHSVHYRWRTLSASLSPRQGGQAGRLPCFISGSGFISNSSVGAIPKVRHAPRLFGQNAPPPDGARFRFRLAVAPPIILSSEPPRSIMQPAQSLWA